MSKKYETCREYPGIRAMFKSMLNVAGLRSCDNIPPDLSPIRKRRISHEIRKGEVEILSHERFITWQSNSRIAEKEEQEKQEYANKIECARKIEQEIVKKEIEAELIKSVAKKWQNSPLFIIADQNAQDLIDQELEAKLKAEKKRLKKRKQKEKKNEFNEDSCVNGSEKINYSSDKSSNDIEEVPLNTDKKEEEDIDINAAFVKKAATKLKDNSIILKAPKNKIIDRNSLVKTALDYENKEHYKEAIKFLSDAINLSPMACDLILKRSFIYYQLAKFKKSIRDAEKVLEYDPNNVEGYYRLGEGHFAMNNLFEAETAFTKLLSLDNAHKEETSKRLFSIRIKQLEGMGYCPNEAFTALLKSKNKTLDEAIEFLTDLKNGKVATDDLYYSDEEESEEEEDDVGNNDVASGPLVESATKPTIIIDKKNPFFTDPLNPTRCCSLFVGNLKKNITNKEVEDVFIKFGAIQSIRLVTDPNCYGFVNFKESSSAGCAMEALQGSRWLLSTVPLTVRYSNKAIISSIHKTA